jgi:hypothetical protein
VYGKLWWEFYIPASRERDFFEGQAERDGIDEYVACKGCETAVGKRKREDEGVQHEVLESPSITHIAGPSACCSAGLCFGLPLCTC